MRKTITALCCLAMAYMGYALVTNIESDAVQQNALHAATIPSWNYNGQLPLDLQLDAAKSINLDTVQHDTVLVEKIKYIRVPVPQSTTDTIYVPLDSLREIEVTPVKNRSPGDEQTDEPDETHSVVLIIDGNQVYSSKTDHPVVSDEP